MLKRTPALNVVKVADGVGHNLPFSPATFPKASRPSTSFTRSEHLHAAIAPRTAMAHEVVDLPIAPASWNGVQDALSRPSYDSLCVVQ